MVFLFVVFFVGCQICVCCVFVADAVSICSFVGLYLSVCSQLRMFLFLFLRLLLVCEFCFALLCVLVCFFVCSAIADMFAVLLLFVCQFLFAGHSRFVSVYLSIYNIHHPLLRLKELRLSGIA